MGLKDIPVDELTIEQCKQEMKRIGKLFDGEQYNLTGNFFDPIVTAMQLENIAEYLIEKGVIDREEFGLRYYRQFAGRLREMEEQLLPRVRQQRIKQMVQQSVPGPQIFGPNGNPLQGD
jgi:hypothetical protein